MKMLICTMLVGIILSGTSAAVIDVPFVGRFFPSESGDRSVGSNNPQSRNNFVPIRTATSVSGGSLYEAHDYQRSFGKTTGDGDKFCEGDFADVGKGSEVDNVVNDIDRKSHDDNNTQSVRGNAEIPLIETTGAVKDRNCGDKQDSGDLQDDGGNSNNGDDSNSSDGPDGSDGSQGSAPADDDSTTQPGAATTKTVEPLNSLRPNDILDLLKQEWAALLEAAPGPRAVERVLSGVPLRDALRGSETLTTNPTDAPHAPHQFAAGSRAPLWANGTDHESLYRQLLAQFLDPLATAGSGSSSSSAVGGSGSGKGRETDTGSMRRRRSLWLDQEFALNLKGTAVLAQHPELLLAGAESISSGSGSIRSKAEAASESATAAMAAAAGLVRRGIRLRAPAPPPPPAPAPAAAQQPPPGMSMDFLGMGGFGSFAPSASPPLGPSPPSSAAAATAPSSSARLSGQCALQNTLVRALAHSLGARMIYLNRRSVEAVRAAGRLRGLPRASLGTANVLRALFDLLRDDPPHHQPLGGYCEEEEGESEGRLRNSSGAGNSGWGTVGGGSVVVLNDALGWLLQSEEASALLLKELQGDQGGRRNTQPASRTVFVAIEPDEAVKIGNALPSAATRTAGAGALADTVAAAGNGYAAEGPPGQQQQPFPFPFPLPPPGFSQGKNGVPLPPAVMGRTFQVVIRNGTATMSALPPGSNGLPLGLIPAPPEAVMRRIIAEHQRRMQQQQHVHNSPDSVASSSTSTTGLPQLPPGSMSFPQLPPGFGGGGPLDPALGKALQSMSGEQLQEFMQDPENQAKMKGLMESIMKTVSEQVARQIGGEGGPGAGDSVDIQLHMMPVPMPVPMHPTPTSAGAGERATTSHGPPAGDRSGQKNEGKKKGFKPDKEGRTRKGSKAGKCGGGGGSGKRASQAAEQVAAERAGNGERLPGSFFRGVARRSRGSDTKDSAAHMSSSPSESGSASDTEDARSITPSRTDKRTDNRSSSSGGKGRGGRGRADVSLSGKQVLGLFQEFTLEAPREHGLRVLWERFQEEEVGGRILRANLRLLRVELRHWGLRVERGAVAALGDVLRRKAMAREQVRSAITAAIKLQAGKFDPVHSIGPHIPSVPLSRDAPSANTAVAGEDGLRAAETGAGIEPRRSTDNDAGNDGKEARRATAAPRMVLSHWALDSAFCAALQVPTPRLGRPAARSREEISELAEDKHEKALVANIISPQDIGVTYDQIGGLEEVKELMRQCVTYPLKYPRLYQEGVAAEAVKGVLLFGPPGTGKTMLAKAVATEGGATFMSIDASTIENKWLGESEKNARAVFTLARRLAPCVVYLDEVDSILSSRERGDDSSHGTLTSVKTTLMQEWDGLRTTKDRVVVIASTNRPFDLDEAVLRRLPRRILVDLPDLQTRSEILQVTLAGNRLAADVNVTVLAQQMEGFTGSDIKEVCREAAVRVAHERARMLESGMDVHTTPLATVARSGNSYSDSSRRNCYNEGNHDGGQDMYRQAGVEAVVVPDFNAPLRPICAADFSAALRKLKASVDDSGSEMGKVMEWNEKYGEFKRRRDGGGSNLYSLYV